MSRQPVALVTGANRGIGREVCRQLGALGHEVYLGSRDPAAGRRAAAVISADGAGADIHPIQLDVTRQSSIDAAIATITADRGRLDVLVNNAAVHYDDHQSVLEPDFAIVEQAFATNLFGAWHLTLAAVPALRESAHPRIVNVSSGAGAMADMGGHLPAYRLSKVSLNALTRILAAELAADRVLVNAVCPGWVATDMGGPGGRPVAQGAAGIVWAATLPDDGPTGGFFRDGRPIPW
jgi:NAD(P)-dependent dehydrogenase (short-subunit alcohol dehydrogenase family)